MFLGLYMILKMSIYIYPSLCVRGCVCIYTCLHVHACMRACAGALSRIVINDRHTLL